MVTSQQSHGDLIFNEKLDFIRLTQVLNC